MKLIAFSTARQRVLLATLVLLLLLTGVAAIATWRAQADKKADRAVDRRAAVVAALDNARARTFRMAAQLAVSIFSDKPVTVDEMYLQGIEAIDSDMMAARAGLMDMGESDKIEALDKVDAQMNALTHDTDVVALITAMGTDAQIEQGRMYYPLVWPRMENMMADLDRLADGERSALAAERSSAIQTANVTLVVLVGFSTFALLGAAATLIVLVVSVVRPLASLQESARAVALGDLKTRARVFGPEEVASLARDFNGMVEERERAERALKLQAVTDSLTGLPNHRALYETLAEETDSSLENERPLSVMLLDIDGFKLFNDTYGHHDGDQVLRQVARLLEQDAPSGSTVGRYGADEFMLIMPGTGPEEAVARADRILDTLSRERVQPREGHDLPLAASIGLAFCPDDSTHKEELIAYVDASLLEAKQLTEHKLVVARQEVDDDVLSRQRTPFAVLDALVRAVDRKDSYTRRHSQQNAEYAVELGKSLGLSEGAVDALRIGALLHDVGKIGVPNDILRKPGPLTEEERSIMHEHVVLSNLIVHGVPNLQDVSDAVYSHHERWDGNGYPRGLKGEEIRLGGRIMAIVDAYSAMILDRPYRKALTEEQAVAELRKNAGSQFDPALVEPFILLLESRQAAAA